MITDDAIRERVDAARGWHSQHAAELEGFARAFEEHVRTGIRSQGDQLAKARFDLRVKAADSYAAKAAKVFEGQFKYESFETEVTDLVAARITVPMSLDLPAALDFVRNNFIVEEEVARGSEDDNLIKPGYRSTHFLVYAPTSTGLLRQVVEIQVRTILQHAWAELQHDLLYKTDTPLEPLVQRRLLALAGILELAEKEFGEVRLAHAGVSSVTGSLNASTLRSLCAELFGTDDPAAAVWYDSLAGVLQSLGLTTVEELVATLGPWVARGKDFANVARTRRAGTNQAVLLDLLLRLALRERYWDKRPPTTWNRVAKPAQLELWRGAFLAELDDVVAKVGV